MQKLTRLKSDDLTKSDVHREGDTDYRRGEASTFSYPFALRMAFIIASPLSAVLTQCRGHRNDRPDVEHFQRRCVVVAVKHLAEKASITKPIQTFVRNQYQQKCGALLLRGV